MSLFVHAYEERERFFILTINHKLIIKFLEKMFCEISLGVLGVVLAGLYFVIQRQKRERIDFHGKHVVITGGSQGIGHDLTIEAFVQGAHVSVLARNQQKLDEIRDELENIKKKNPTLSAQLIQVESIDISKSFEETKKIFDKVRLSYQITHVVIRID